MLPFSKGLFGGKLFERLVPVGDIISILVAGLFIIWVVSYCDRVGEISPRNMLQLQFDFHEQCPEKGHLCNMT